MSYQIGGNLIRKLTLAEWFLKYQLDFIDKKYNHLNAFVDINFENIISHYENLNEKIPMTSLLVKACGIWQERCPEINRQVFSTIFGKRMSSCDSYCVNIPIVLNNKGNPYVSVAQVNDANSKGLNIIKSEIKEYLRNDPASLPIGKILVGKKNTLFNRMRLKVMHFIVNQFPRIQEKYNVGTISVSSLLNLDHFGNDVTFIAKGPGAISICVCSIDYEHKKMKLGIAWDHGTGHGYEGVNGTHELCRILSGKDNSVFQRLVSLT